jgi:formate-dependent nitrite reductase membrane component NrfD
MVNTNDLSLVLGIILAVLAIPSLLNAWTEDRAPRFGAIIGLTGVVLIGLAMARHPSGYALNDIPPAFGRVFRAFLF